MNSNNQIPESFWKELEDLYNSEIGKEEVINKDEQNEISASFWNELQELYKFEEKSGIFEYNPQNEPENSTLEKLEKFFELINENARKVVDLEKQKNPHNPLFYPFSLFQPMNRLRDEVHYTKTLAWLMNYNYEILKEIMLLFRFESDNFKKYHVEAEVCDNEQKNRLDISLMEEDQIIVAIEAKIDSEEGKKISKRENREPFQLKAYDKWLDELHPNCKTRIFLVVDENIEISSENWDVFTWKDVAITLLKFLKNADPATHDFHYLSFFIASIIQDIYEIDPKNNLAIANLINMTREK